jgi:predicted ATP-grasp superfamily ATP-dependent carboligase
VKLFIYEYATSVAREDIPNAIRREGRAMFEAAVADAGASTLVGPETTLFFTDLPPAAERARLQALAAAADFALIVAPEFDGLLLQRLEWVLEAGGRLLGPGPLAVRLTGDKWQMYQHWRQRGVPTPLTWLDEMTPPCPGPYVSKWREGAGSQEMRLSADFEPRGERFIWQRFQPGLPASVTFLAGRHGRLLPLLPGEQRLSAGGRFEYAGGILPLPPQMAERAVRLGRQALADIPELLGWVGVDLVLDESGDEANDVVIEVNARLTTSYLGLRALSRKNLITLMLALAQGEDVRPAWNPGRVIFTPDGQVRWLSDSPTAEA